MKKHLTGLFVLLSLLLTVTTHADTSVTDLTNNNNNIETTSNIPLENFVSR